MENKIIIKARELCEGRGDGRISAPDMKVLLTYDYDNFENISALFHIYDNFNLTDSALTVFIDNIFKWSKMYTVIKTHIE